MQFEFKMGKYELGTKIPALFGLCANQFMRPKLNSGKAKTNMKLLQTAPRSEMRSWQ